MLKPTDKKTLQKIDVKKFNDFRGELTKLYQQQSEIRDDLKKIQEVYICSSHSNVMRGLHFQRGPAAQEKFIHCLDGEFLDITVDLQVGESFGHIHVEHMTHETDYVLRVPGCFAHGILVIKDGTRYLNLSPDPYLPGSESGIHWKSLNLSLPTKNPITTEKDSLWPSINEVLTGLKG